MDPIQEAIEDIESHDQDEHFTYTQVAKKYGVDRRTLARRHQGLTQPRHLAQVSLHPEHETELIQYIKSLTDRRTPPTRVMVRSFASSLVGREVSESWVTRFLNRNQIHLISAWQTGMDRDRHKADSVAKYSLYFDLLHDKMKEYNVLPGQIYNMDEKGFMIGVTGRSKRVFDKGLYGQKGVTAAVQDGNREWVTVIACVCSDGQALPPSLIFESANNTIQSSWVASIEQDQHSVFVSSSPSGWTTNDIGLAWLKEVFDRETRRKARSSYRLLILDGHGSHVTMDFIQYCNDNKILLAVFPPHSTHTLQPLDVVLFKPLSDAYSTQLSSHLHTSQGLLPVQKGDFFPLFWRAWGLSFTPTNVKKAFEATGIYPPNRDVILKRFNKEASSSDESSTSVLSGQDWLKIESLIRKSTRDESTKEAKKLRRSLHHISVQNELLHHEIQGLKEALMVKKKHKKKRFTLQLNSQEGYHGGAVFWSPRKVRQARDDEVSRQREVQQQQLQKAERSQLKEQARLYKLQQAEERRVERERAKEVREKEKAAKVAEKEAQKAARDAEKAIQLSQKGKRKASQGSTQKQKRQKRVVVDSSHVQAKVAAPAVPTRTTRHGRTTKLPSKYK
jgi:hypothetical protein